MGQTARIRLLVMSAMPYRLFAALIAFTSASCASMGTDPNTLVLDIGCTPPGATLYEDNKNIGLCPRTLNYKLSPEDKARGYALLRGLSALWVSGASTSVSQITAELRLGQRQEFRFERPRSVPNYDVDANYALNLEKNKLLREQVDAIQNITVSVEQPPPALPPRTNCVSRRLGGAVYTDCN
jgi:hypothetical protein